jgi:hypothetical protein
VVESWRRELAGHNDAMHRRWLRHSAIRASLGFLAGLALISIAAMLAGIHPAYLLLAIPGLVLQWRVGRTRTWADKTDPLPTPTVEA